MQRCPWNILSDHEKEDSERKEDRNAQGDLLSGIRRETEDNHHQDGEQGTRKDDVDYVVSLTPSQIKGKFDIRVSHLRATG